MVRYDLKQAARAFAPEALETIVRCMRSEDEKIALMASEILSSRAYGRPEQKADLDVVHAFVRVPEVMSQDDWLKSRGQPEILAQMKAACPDARGDIVDITPSDEPDPTKLDGRLSVISMITIA
jgi:hypothetical protein